MRKFFVELFTNRFGIVLATLNLCFFASRINNFNAPPFGKFFASLNFPAIGSTILSVNFIKMFVYQFSLWTEVNLGNIIFAVFIVLQWLFIAWLAGKISSLPSILKSHVSWR